MASSRFRRYFRPSRLLFVLRRFLKNDQLILSVLSLVVGGMAGWAVVLFRKTIELVQLAAFGYGGERLLYHTAGFAWWHVVLTPALGGLVIGVFVYRFMPGRRPHGVAEVIEANALKGGRTSFTVGLKAAVVNAASIGVGASVGREGPAVHMGAALAGWTAKRLRLTRALSRTLLGCGVAAAVASSFNAPIAGALFASEVVIGHYALSAFAPIVIASVTGTVVSSIYFGSTPAFAVPEHLIASFLEFPAFAGLGIVAGLTALAFMWAVMAANRAAEKMPVAPWLRPAIGGAMVGAVAVFYPYVLGIGYGTTELVLAAGIPAALLIAVLAAKIAATAISIGFGFGGGVFSPSLVIGALLGSAYGMMATGIFPELSSGPEAYAIVGMGGVTAAVLGAPISTILIVFEMTGNYKLTIAVMVAVVVSSMITRGFHGGSFFLWQLERLGVDIKGGFETALLRGINLGQVMTRTNERVNRGAALEEVRKTLQESETGSLFVVRDDGTLYGAITLADLSEAAFDHDFDDLIKAGDVARTRPPTLAADDDLEAAMKMMRETGEHRIAVVEDRDSMFFLGCVHERDVIAAYNKALVEARREERDG
ncbi:MAG TPA: CBS domain-containing protein [Alphaproteobacteria bacterium]|nr:CBS domain-containing protein [Alphaproteobacteria bacterium]